MPGGEIFAGLPGAPDQIARRLGDAGIRVARTGNAGAGWVVRVAAERPIAPSSVTGISLLIGLCAAAWFSGGTRSDAVRGLIATGVWVLSRVGARQLAAMTARLNRRAAPVGRGRAGQREPDRSDWLILPGFDWTAADAPPVATAGRSASDEARERRFGWLYAVCATAAECAIYGGIAAGAQASGYTGTWPLALAAVIAGSVAVIARTIEASLAARPCLRHVLSLPPLGIRALLAALTMVAYGPRIALFTVLVIDVAILARAITRTARQMSPRRRTVAPEVLLACRDDGPLARRAGRLVRGNLMPMPPAVAGLIAIGMLSVLGIRNLPGVVALTPVVVLLLAAPGSSHPHDGRWDWLVPVLLCLGQFGYLVAFGAARSVPWLVIFTMCAMIAVRYTSLAASQATATAPRIGWDGRVCLVGLAGIFGFATFGYLGLTACLGAQICGKAVSDYLRQGEDRGR